MFIMKNLTFFLLLLLVLAGWYACTSSGPESTTEKLLHQYRQDVAQLVKQSEKLISAAEHSDVNAIQKAFAGAKLAYKQVEWLAVYYQPYTTRFINGPALAEVEPEDKVLIIEPEGFQVIEELIYPNLSADDRPVLLQQVKKLQSTIRRLQATAETLQTTDAHLFDALRLQVFRLIALGISGFDSPIAHHSLTEASASMGSLERYLAFYRPALKKKRITLNADLHQLLTGAQTYLAAHPDFDAFDRMAFIRRYANPLSENLLLAQVELGFPVFDEPRPLRPDAKNLFAADAFNPDYYAPGADAYSTVAKQRLGEQLFYDPVLSANESRSCGSCHQPGKAFTDALKTNKALATGIALKRNTPSLLNAALQPALFYDSRVAFLEDQAVAVIQSKEEMHGSLQAAVQKLKQQARYRRLFAQAFPNNEINEYTVKNALASYVRSLVSLHSRFDEYVHGNNRAMTAEEIQGFNLFMGKAKCGTCHFAPLFNGSNPPEFTKIDAEVLGVPATADTLHPRLDPDDGKFYSTRLDLYRGAFKTPTVRNSAFTAPYMHNGVFGTLEEVVAFYNRGGGRGLGLPVQNQTLPAEPLHLSTTEQKAVVAFLHTLSDTTSFARFKREP